MNKRTTSPTRFDAILALTRLSAAEGLGAAADVYALVARSAHSGPTRPTGAANGSSPYSPAPRPVAAPLRRYSAS